MNQRVADAPRIEVALEGRTRFAEFDALADDRSYAKPFADEVVQSDPFGRHVPPVDARLEGDIVLAFDSLEGLRFDQREVAAVSVGEGPVGVVVAITLESAPGDGAYRSTRSIGTPCSGAMWIARPCPVIRIEWSWLELSSRTHRRSSDAAFRPSPAASRRRLPRFAR